MAKIRGVKPELWTDENFVELSPFARLLWIGLWNHACDNGHLQDKSKQIKLRILPMDEVNCAELLREIEGQDLIYREAGWITIPNLSHHQKPHRRWWTTCDKEGCNLPDGASHTPSNRGATVVPPKRNRGTTADVDCESDGDGDGDGESEVTTSSDKSDARKPPSRFDEFWDAYSNKEGRKTAIAAYRAALKKPGVNDDLLITAASAYIAWQMSEGKHPRFTKAPTTWLRGEHWTDERADLPAQQTNLQAHMALVEELGEESSNVSPFRQIGPSR